MLEPKTRFCLSRAENEGEFELKAGDFVYHPPRRTHDFMEYSDDIEIFELASPADHSAIDV